ncbi:hypothetical protein PM10SUCC1_16540 [Propionigenium maris DSM 9537]|uniref:DUF4132 domain-containing protein n=1 Tax=Propionigenium maris DSM 9537 TaxID=1123000 RepID=A0A9W6GL29_9FUSO|nr:DUF4132 domain-containing protein [Propionigenium maris]GLI56140.1 hypothetical protein PM10SUCC1_16540 [Propionigenium maris DSM 9537]
MVCSCLLTDLEDYRRCADGGCGISMPQVEIEEEFELDYYLDEVYPSRGEPALDLERMEVPVRIDGGNPTRAVSYLIDIYREGHGDTMKDEGLLIGSCMTRESMGRFVRSIYDHWNYKGCRASDKWLLMIPVIHGNRCNLREVESLIYRLGGNSMQRIALYLIEAMVVRGDMEALITLNRIRKLSKYKSLRAGAQEALEEVAKKLDISRYEVEDLFIGDMGFGRGDIMVDYGGEVMKLHLEDDFTIGIERESGRIIKALPKKPYMSVGMMETRDRLKELKKEIKRELKLQRDRLEEALREFRRWRGEPFRELLLKNLVMSRLGRCLLWGIYNGDTLETPFYVEDDFYTIDGKKVVVEDSSSIALVHPMELSWEEIEAWRSNFSERVREDLLGQLTREAPSWEEVDTQKFPRCSSHRVAGRLKKWGWNSPEENSPKVIKEVPELNLRAEVALDSPLCTKVAATEDERAESTVGVKSIKFYPMNLKWTQEKKRETAGISERVATELTLEVKKAFI